VVSLNLAHPVHVGKPCLIEAWLHLNLYWMSLANFKPKIISALRGFLAAARLSCIIHMCHGDGQYLDCGIVSTSAKLEHRARKRLVC